MVPGVGDNYVPFFIDSNSLGPEKLPVASAFSAQESGGLKVRTDHKQTVIVEISDDHVAIMIERNTTW